MTSEIEDKLKELASNLMASLCCGSDLPEDNYTLDEIFGVIKDAYDIGSKSVIWHKFPDELPEDFQKVLTVALSYDIDEGPEKFYHVFTFGEKRLLKEYLEHNREPSHLFLQWNSSNNYEVVAWCELPEYKG